jgi:hypothetical protein
MTKVWRCEELIPARGRVAFDPPPAHVGTLWVPRSVRRWGERIPVRDRVAFDPSRARVGTLQFPRSEVEAEAD